MLLFLVASNFARILFITDPGWPACWHFAEACHYISWKTKRDSQVSGESAPGGPLAFTVAGLCNVSLFLHYARLFRASDRNAGVVLCKAAKTANMLAGVVVVQNSKHRSNQLPNLNIFFLSSQLVQASVVLEQYIFTPGWAKQSEDT